MLISPSILSVYQNNLDHALSELNKVKTDMLHLDVMDNKFVPNQTFNHTFVKKMREKTNFILDTHLMIEHPELYYKDYTDTGTDYLTFHVEATNDPGKLIDMIHEEKVKAGVSIKPGTPVDDIIPLLEKIDLVLIMSVEPGFGGQKFITSALDKIKQLSQIKKEKNLSFLIEVDGGINEENALLVKNVGCDAIVVGSYLMNSDSIANTYQKLKQI